MVLSLCHRKPHVPDRSLVLGNQRALRLLPRSSNLKGGAPLPEPPPAPTLFSTRFLLQQSLVMGSASAILGPLCDGLHSQYGVLEYAAPITPFQAVHWDFETTWWTPLLFALAGIILGVSHPILDANFPESKPRGGTDPSWTFVLTAIAGFVLQYFLSAKGAAVLDSYMLPDGNIVLDVVLAATALAHWAVFDATKQGLFMAALTAVAGPAVEVLLIKQGLYAYAHPQLFGAIPTWIAWVYFCGSPAVGSLGRKVAAELTAMQRLS